MKNYLLTFLFMAAFSAFAQENINHRMAPWLGVWKGEMSMTPAVADPGKIPVSLEIAPTDTAGRWKWCIVYGDSVPDVRDYRLVYDTASGAYVMDEGNSIMLGMFSGMQGFFSIFEVNGYLLVAEYVLQRKNRMLFRILYAGTSSPIKSGGLTEDIPEVISYPVAGLQTTYLKRQKNYRH